MFSRHATCFFQYLFPFCKKTSTGNILAEWHVRGCATRRTTCTYLGNHEKTVTRCLHNTHSHPDPGQNVLNTVSSQLHATLVSDCRVNIAVARKVFVVARHVGLAIEYTVSHSRKTLTSPFHIDFHNRHYNLYSPTPEAKAKAKARARAVLQSLSSFAHCTLFLTVADHAGKQCHDRLTAFVHAFSCGFLCFRTNLKNTFSDEEVSARPPQQHPEYRRLLQDTMPDQASEIVAFLGPRATYTHQARNFFPLFWFS